MNWYLIFYLFSIAERISSVLGAVAVVAIIVSGICGFVYGMTGGEYETPPKILKWSLPLALFFGLVWAALPDKKDMLLIVAGGAVGEFVAHDENAKAIPSEVTKWLRAELQSATAELNPVTQAEKEKLMNMPQEELVKQLMAAKDSSYAK